MSGSASETAASMAQIQQALSLIHGGRLNQASALLADVLRREPLNFNALQLQGHIALQTADYTAAARWLSAARGVNSSSAPVHSNLGVALLALQRPQEALQSCDRALDLMPAFHDAHAGRAKALSALKRPAEALAAFDRALSLSPDSAEGHNNRGTALRALKRPREALAAYETALRLRPQFPEVYCNVANLALDAGRCEEALSACAQALSIRPDFPEALNIRGTALRGLRRYEEAATVYETILAKEPRFGHASSHLLISRAHVCHWRDRDRQAGQVIERVASGESASAPHAFLWLSDSAPLQLGCARLYTQEEFPAAQPLWQGERYRHERLRIAYLSADFADHPVAHLIAGVLERHDRSRFETFGISLGRDAAGGPMRERLARAFEHFHDVAESNDREAAAWLREREIDLVVDLTAHTRGGRLGILACRPAPLQINFLGFAGTSGAGFMDYLIGDEVVIPSGQERFFSERVIRMPHSFLPNDDGQTIAVDTPRRRDLGLPESGFVFCAFNNPYKINPVLFDVWMRLLRETPGSVLWLRLGEGPAAANLGREAEARGVAAERLVLAPRMPAMDAHLARYRLADLFLDTLPYGAHATARDALWAGLPVLTCTGNSFAGRVAASLLTALDMPELIAASLEDYASRALALANSPGRLADLRARLAQQRATCPLFDTDLYRQHLESAYRAVCERQWRGESPGTFSVPRIR